MQVARVTEHVCRNKRDRNVSIPCSMPLQAMLLATARCQSSPPNRGTADLGCWSHASCRGRACADLSSTSSRRRNGASVCEPALRPHTRPIQPHPGLAQGYNSGGVPLLVVGVGKGAIGALGRPAVGLLECTSKTAHAAALACLGKEGIVGTVQRRVRPPGVSSILLEEGLLEVSVAACAPLCFLLSDGAKQHQSTHLAQHARPDALRTTHVSGMTGRELRCSYQVSMQCHSGTALCSTSISGFRSQSTYDMADDHDADALL